MSYHGVKLAAQDTVSIGSLLAALVIWAFLVVISPALLLLWVASRLVRTPGWKRTVGVLVFAVVCTVVAAWYLG